MNNLSIDIETYSSYDIKLGVYKYTEAPDFEILIFAYKEDNEEVQIVDLLNGETIPFYIMQSLTDPKVKKHAYNAAFEICCIEKHFKIDLDTHQWSCTMVLAVQAGLPFGLDNVAKILKLPDQKDAAGKALIKYFSVPCKPNKSNGQRTRNMPIDDLFRWNKYKEYCIQDVVTENAVAKAINWFTPSAFERGVWQLDQRINKRGVLVDTELVSGAVALDAITTDRLKAEMVKLTKIINPKSFKQIKDFIESETEITVDTLNKDAIPELKKRFSGDPKVLKVLELKEKLSLSSIRKYNSIQNSATEGNRVRGLFQYYGAARTGRWSGRNVQLQNLKRNNLDDLDLARNAVKRQDLDYLDMCYDDVPVVLSNLIRTAFIPGPGKALVVSDFSAIEARVIAWLAGETWRLEVFRTHGKIYEASAAAMFKIPIEEVTKDLRAKGKVAELALGYQGGPGALARAAVGGKALTEAEAGALVRKWRQVNPNIVRLWYSVQDAVKDTILNRKATQIRFLKFHMKSTNLIITLPSGRELVYPDARIVDNRDICYGSLNSFKKWVTEKSYGGKLVENIVQAIARDVLTEALKNCAVFDIVMHVHDEIVIESDEPEVDLHSVEEIMSRPVAWAKGLPLKAESFITKYYKK